MYLVSVSFFVLVVLEMPKNCLPNPLLRAGNRASKGVQTYFVFEIHTSMSAKKLFCNIRCKVTPFFKINITVQLISTLDNIGVFSGFSTFNILILSYFSTCLTSLQYTNNSVWFVNSIFVVHYFSVCSINYLIKFVYMGLLHIMA